MPNEHWPDHIGELEVTATFGAPGLREQTGRLRFYFTGADRIPARFTGQFSDDTRNGDLAIEVGVNIETEGAYRIEGNLFDGDDQPVAWAQAETDLAPGAHDVALVFYGLAFHDARAVAPFTLRELRGYRLRRGDSPHREPGENRSTSCHPEQAQQSGGSEGAVLHRNAAASASGPGMVPRCETEFWIA